MFVRDADPATLPAIAWSHLVALGWITVTAFSILLHAIPAFLDVTWKHQSFARVCLGGGAVAIAAFVVTLCAAVPALGFVATLVAIALFAVTLAMLALAMALGLMLAWALAGAALHRGSRGFLICGVSAARCAR